jgi:hypothetical protein
VEVRAVVLQTEVQEVQVVLLHLDQVAVAVVLVSQTLVVLEEKAVMAL